MRFNLEGEQFLNAYELRFSPTENIKIVFCMRNSVHFIDFDELNEAFINMIKRVTLDHFS